MLIKNERTKLFNETQPNNWNQKENGTKMLVQKQSYKETAQITAREALSE